MEKAVNEDMRTIWNLSFKDQSDLTGDRRAWF